MVVVAHISLHGAPVADVTYRSGLHVEVRVSESCRDERVSFTLRHSGNEVLEGTWEEALDRYFNEGTFHATDRLFPGESPRVGLARDHKILFREAAFALMKDLNPHGYRVDIEFM